jgi:hypothetical protein
MKHARYLDTMKRPNLLIMGIEEGEDHGYRRRRGDTN